MEGLNYAEFMSQCFTAEQMGNSSTETKSDKLKNSYTTYLMGKNLVKKFEEKKCFISYLDLNKTVC